MPELPYDLIVIGAGPAGLMWVHTGITMGKKVLLIDQGSYSEPSYSSIKLPLSSESKIKLGGIGGTANAWQGQCVRLEKNQFEAIFKPTSDADFDDYLRESALIETLLGIKIGNRSSKLERRARRELNLTDEIGVKFSYIPSILDWRKIFRTSLSHNNLDYLEATVTSLDSEKNRISGIVLKENKKMLVGESTKVVVTTNAITTNKLLNGLDSSLKENGNRDTWVFDHPWRTKYRYINRKNIFVRRKLFNFHVGLGYRMTSKYKFEVRAEGEPIGVFELRPDFQGHIIHKAIARGTQKVFGVSIIAPNFIDVWCQISQSKKHSYGDSDSLENALDLDDIARLEYVEKTAGKILEKTGFKFVSEIENSSIEQAFHTTGTVEFSSEGNLQKFDYPGVANKIKNLHVSGAACLGNCSWINPTFSILVLASLNAKLAFQATSEI
jgi:hypothetical protein